MSSLLLLVEALQATVKNQKGTLTKYNAVYAKNFEI